MSNSKVVKEEQVTNHQQAITITLNRIKEGLGMDNGNSLYAPNTPDSTPIS